MVQWAISHWHVVSHNGSTAILVKHGNAPVGQAEKDNGKYKHITESSIPIEHYEASFQIHGKKSTEASQTWLPLILSWAITIHKVQGLGLDAVVVHMTKSKCDYKCGQAYVAFNHVKQLNGLHIVKYMWEQIKANACINQFMESNRARQILHIQHALTQNPYTGITVIYENVQDLSPHKKNEDGYTTVTAAYIICMSETHLQQTAKITMATAKSFAAMNFHTERSERTVSSGGGIAVCIWKTLGQIERLETIYMGIELVHVKRLLNPVINVLCTYKPPNKNLKICRAQLYRYLQEKVPLPEQYITLWDFDDSLMSGTNIDLIQRIRSLGFKQNIHGTLIRSCIQP